MSWSQKEKDLFKSMCIKMYALGYLKDEDVLEFINEGSLEKADYQEITSKPYPETPSGSPVKANGSTGSGTSDSGSAKDSAGTSSSGKTATTSTGLSSAGTPTSNSSSSSTGTNKSAGQSSDSKATSTTKSK